MEDGFETPTTTTTTTNGDGVATYFRPEFQDPNNGKTAIFHETYIYSDDIDSTCFTPYVNAPSNPDYGSGGCGRRGFFYSAPASPMHFIMYSSSPNSTPLVSGALVSGSCELEFSTRLGTIGSSLTESMISVDELFLNSQIRPMKLSSHLQRHQVLAPLLDLNENEDDCENVMNEFDKFLRGRNMKWWNKSLRRRTSSLSTLRFSSFQWDESDDED